GGRRGVGGRQRLRRARGETQRETDERNGRDAGTTKTRRPRKRTKNSLPKKDSAIFSSLRVVCGSVLHPDHRSAKRPFDPSHLSHPAHPSDAAWLSARSSLDPGLRKVVAS